MSLAAGARLGPYELLDLLGAGGMGEVYRARDTRLDRTVAIKVLPPELASDPERRQRFEREARAIASLTHPHICTLYEFDRAPAPTAESAIDFLVMEHLEGETLEARLRRAAQDSRRKAQGLRRKAQGSRLAARVVRRERLVTT